MILKVTVLRWFFLNLQQIYSLPSSKFDSGPNSWDAPHYFLLFFASILHFHFHFQRLSQPMIKTYLSADQLRLDMTLYLPYQMVQYTCKQTRRHFCLGYSLSTLLPVHTTSCPIIKDLIQCQKCQSKLSLYIFKLIGFFLLQKIRESLRKKQC